MDFLIDTGFLVWRWRQGMDSPEQRFIETHADATVAMPWIVKGEFLRGAVLANQPDSTVEEFLARYATLWPSEVTLNLYARTYASLVRQNQLIGPNDLWIAASALEHSVPLLTRNANEFRRVEGLGVVAYAEG